MSSPASGRPRAGLLTVREIALLAAILAAGALLRGAYLTELRHEPDFTQPSLDPQYHDYWARALATGDWSPPPGLPDPEIRTSPYTRPPAYPWFLAGLYWVTGGSWYAARAAQMALGLINGILLYLLARFLFGRAAALVAMALMLTYWAFIYFEGELHEPVLSVFAVLALMHAMRAWHDKPNLARAVCLGLALGFLALVRANALLFGPALVAWMAWVTWPGRGAWPVARSVVLTTAAALLVVAPVTLRNHRVSGEFFPVADVGGINLFIGNNPLTDNVLPRVPGMRDLIGRPSWTLFDYPAIRSGIARELGRESVTYGEVNGYFKQKAWDFIHENPTAALRNVGKRALLFWGPHELTNNKVIHFAKRNSSILRWLPGFPLVFGLFALGLAAWARGPRRDARAVALGVLAFVLVYFASFLPFFVASRFRVPVIPLLLLFGAHGLCALWEAVRVRQWKPAAVLAACGCAAGGFAAVPWVPYVPEEDFYRLQRARAYVALGDREAAAVEYEQAIRVAGQAAGAEPYRGLADMAIQDGRLDAAAKLLREGLAVDPSDAALNNTLAQVCLEQGRPQEAVPLYKEALKAQPGEPGLLNNLANALAEAGRLDEAMPYYEQAVRGAPDFANAYCNWGVALARQGDHLKALEKYDEGRRLGAGEPTYAPSLGEMLERLGDEDTAIAVYNTQFELEGINVSAHVNIGNILVSRGRIDEAVTHYERAIEIDAEHRDAHFNLAVVLAAQGKADAAAPHFQKCLELEPGDVEAANQYGFMLARQGRFEEAIGYYQKAVATGHATAAVHNNLGNAHAATRQFEDALREYRKSAELDPADKTVHYNCARVLTILGRFDEAVESYKKAIENHPGGAVIHRNYGQLLTRMGRQAEAQKEFEEALRLAPDDTAARALLDALPGKQ